MFDFQALIKAVVSRSYRFDKQEKWSVTVFSVERKTLPHVLLAKYSNTVDGIDYFIA